MPTTTLPVVGAKIDKGTFTATLVIIFALMLVYLSDTGKLSAMIKIMKGPPFPAPTSHGWLWNYLFGSGTPAVATQSGSSGSSSTGTGSSGNTGTAGTSGTTGTTGTTGTGGSGTGTGTTGGASGATSGTSGTGSSGTSGTTE